MGLGIVILFIGCNDTPFSTPESEAAQGLTSDPITWISWKKEVVDQIKSRKLLRGTTSKLIKADKGGKVGGGKTFRNEVYFPEGALEEDTWITVEVICVDGNKQCGASVDFQPTGKFRKDVKVTLSWEYINYDGGELNLYVHYSVDGGDSWIKVENPEINTKKETVTVYVDHFTRFAWGF